MSSGLEILYVEDALFLGVVKSQITQNVLTCWYYNSELNIAIFHGGDSLISKSNINPMLYRWHEDFVHEEVLNLLLPLLYLLIPMTALAVLY